MLRFRFALSGIFLVTIILFCIESVSTIETKSVRIQKSSSTHDKESKFIKDAKRPHCRIICFPVPGLRNCFQICPIQLTKRPSLRCSRICVLRGVKLRCRLRCRKPVERYCRKLCAMFQGKRMCSKLCQKIGKTSLPIVRPTTPLPIDETTISMPTTLFEETTPLNPTESTPSRKEFSTITTEEPYTITTEATPTTTEEEQTTTSNPDENAIASDE